MRVIKGIVLFCFSVVAVSACFDPPEFSNTPKIVYNSIKFKEVGGVADYDSLILSIDFKDGNGDVGLSASDEADFAPPYNSEFYFLTSGVGDTVPIIATDRSNYTVLNDYIGVTNEVRPGKIVTSKTRNQPNYGYLPVYNANSCVNYSFLVEALVPLPSVTADFDIQDTLTVDGRQYALIQEAVLYRRNPNHYNIEIKFWEYNGTTFVEYDWFKNYCLTYNGRFTTTLNSGGFEERPIEGTLRYAMPNTSFLAIFGSKRLKISARIRDRALNTSNLVYTEVFDLNQIR